MKKKKKLLFLAVMHKSTTHTALTRAFEYLGWETKVFDYRDLTAKEKLIQLGLGQQSALKSMNSRLIEAVKDYKPDITFTVKGELIFPETIRKISKSGIRTVQWFPDDVHRHQMAKELSRVYDVFFHYDSYETQLLIKETKRKNIYHFGFAADILPSDPTPNFSRRHYSLVMVGNYYPVRENYLPYISDLDLDIWGEEKWRETSVASKYHEPLPFSQLLALYRNSKIGLNIQFVSPSHSIVNRAYEIISSGAMLLSERKPELGKYFALGKDVVGFTSPKQMREKAIYYLANRHERESIAKRGYKVVRAQHKYIDRIKSLERYL